MSVYTTKKKLKIVFGPGDLPFGYQYLDTALAKRELNRLCGQDLREHGVEGRLLDWTLTKAKIKNSGVPTLSIKGELTVFCPVVGSRVTGEVVEVAPTHILIRTHGIFIAKADPPSVAVHPGQHVDYTFNGFIPCTGNQTIINGDDVRAVDDVKAVDERPDESVNGVAKLVDRKTMKLEERMRKKSGTTPGKPPPSANKINLTNGTTNGHHSDDAEPCESVVKMETGEEETGTLHPLDGFPAGWKLRRHVGPKTKWCTFISPGGKVFKSKKLALQYLEQSNIPTLDQIREVLGNELRRGSSKQEILSWVSEDNVL